MTIDRLPSPIDRIKLSRRELLVGLGLVGVASVVGGDTTPKPPESPIGKYELVVAFGDSYAYGLGATSPEYGYIARLASRLQAKRFENLAHSGASPGDMLRASGNIPSQIDRLPADASLVVGTAGGNAYDLRKFIMDCLGPGCSSDTPTFEDASAVFRGNDFYDDLKKLYDALLGKAANAPILVNGYPKIIEPLVLPPELQKLYDDSGLPEITALGKANDQAISDIVDMNNTAAQEIISRINDPRLVYVDPPKHIDLITTKILKEPSCFHGAGSEFGGHPNNLGYEKTEAVTFLALVAMYNRHIKSGSLSAARGARR